jgi:hypothetical protein
MLSRTFRVLPVLFLLCAAGAARAQQHPEVCENKLPKDPAYYADMKEFPPGKFGFGYVFDKPQYDNPSAQVVLSGLGGISGAKPRSLKLSCVEVANRSARVVHAVQLRWAVVTQAEGKGVYEGTEVLAKGVLPLVAVEVQPGGKQKVEIQGVQFADFFWPLAAATGEVNGRFNVIIGVARAEFTDGTSLDLP